LEGELWQVAKVPTTAGAFILALSPESLEWLEGQAGRPLAELGAAVFSKKKDVLVDTRSASRLIRLGDPTKLQLSEELRVALAKEATTMDDDSDDDF